MSKKITVVTLIEFSAVVRETFELESTVAEEYLIDKIRDAIRISKLIKEE